VDALGGHAGAAPALDRSVKAQRHGPARRKGGQQQAEQKAGGGPRAPNRAVEHAMTVHEMPLLRQAGDPRQTGHGARAQRQDGSKRQHSARRQLRWKNSGAQLRTTAAKRDGG